MIGLVGIGQVACLQVDEGKAVVHSASDGVESVHLSDFLICLAEQFFPLSQVLLQSFGSYGLSQTGRLVLLSSPGQQYAFFSRRAICPHRGRNRWSQSN